MQLPIPDDWNGEDTCRWSVCWPNSPKWLAILMGLIESPMQGRLWDFSTGNFKTIREQFRPIYNYNFNLEGVIMACNDTGLTELAVQLGNVATALGQLNITQTVNVNGGGSSGCECDQQVIIQNGGVAGYLDNGDGTNTAYYGSVPPVSLEPGTYPEGYESLEAYRLNKCQIANRIIDGLAGTIQAWGMLSGAGLGASLGALLVSLVLPSLLFPPAAVAIVCVAIGVGGAIFAILVQVAQYINTNRSEWVCALYASDSVEEILAVIDGLINTLITALTILAPFSLAVKSIILALLSTDTLNQLFTLQANVAYPDADCSECADPGWYFSYFQSGENIYYSGELVSGSMEADSEGMVIDGGSGPEGIFDPLCWPSYLIQINTPDGTAKNITWSISGWADDSCSNSWAYTDEDDNEVVGYGFPPDTMPLTLCCKALAWRSSTKHTVTITVNSDCTPE